MFLKEILAKLQIIEEVSATTLKPEMDISKLLNKTSLILAKATMDSPEEEEDSFLVSSAISPSSSSSEPFFIRQLHHLHSGSILTIIAIGSVFMLCVLLVAAVLSYRRRAEDEKQTIEYSKHKRFKRQSSRYSIDLDRFVADIMGPGEDGLQNGEKNEINSAQQKQKQISHESSRTLNPLAVSIINLVAKSLNSSKKQKLYHPHNHDEPIPGNIVSVATHSAPPDPKLKSVAEDDEYVLFDEQSLKSISRQSSLEAEEEGANGTAQAETVVEIVTIDMSDPNGHGESSVKHQSLTITTPTSISANTN